MQCVRAVVGKLKIKMQQGSVISSCCVHCKLTLRTSNGNIISPHEGIGKCNSDFQAAKSTCAGFLHGTEAAEISFPQAILLYSCRFNYKMLPSDTGEWVATLCEWFQRVKNNIRTKLKIPGKFWPQNEPNWKIKKSSRIVIDSCRSVVVSQHREMSKNN